MHLDRGEVQPRANQARRDTEIGRQGRRSRCEASVTVAIAASSQPSGRFAWGFVLDVGEVGGGGDRASHLPRLVSSQLTRDTPSTRGGPRLHRWKKCRQP